MKAAVFYESGKPLAIEDVCVKKPGPREVLVRTRAAGLCHSDLLMMEGAFPWPLPTIPGHEASGVVEQVGSEVTYVKPGDHVITCLTVFCGCCAMCTTGRPVLCSSTEIRLPPGVADRFHWERREKLSQFVNVSAFAEQMLVHENALVKIREEMPLDLAALIGCAIITGYGAVVNTANVRPGETVAIIGCGGVGMAAINAAKISGAGRIIAIDTNPAKLRIAATLGATDLVNASEVDPVAQVKELTDGAGVPHSFEVLGSKSTAEQAFAMLAQGGSATILGIMPLGTKIELHGIDFIRERRIQGSYMGSSHIRVDMPRLVDFYLSGQLKLEHWVTARITLQDVNVGFAKMKSGTVLRSLIEFN
ncbi:Zn-dependent alcohol dehydrogenase [Bradyrhizobium vignae]|uniref:Zn-dependent alcohol dehydrogenase n=1 Tax=Bradyrhizobium vignae TaxID=1549949 RepID=UPI00100A544F|nr:Zn-dependent alcohol dehydrogenase [Bradyrhizobium vignae]RXH06675.1 Zn-dependent alcohol dehydrogenase [Bradyrhizobium vignae]